ncbi:MAG: PAS domain S-box protein, partial [Chloroflexota bacterium]
MTLRRKTLLIVSVTLVALVLLLYILLRGILMNSYYELEQEASLRDLNRAVASLQDHAASMERAIHDWSTWDETYTFVQDHNPTFLDSNLGDSTFWTLDVNLMLFVNNSNEIVYSKGVALETDWPSTLLAQVEQYARNDAGFLSLMSNVPTAGLVLVDGEPLLIASRPILHDDDSGPRAGTLVWGRYLGKQELVELSQALRLSVDLLSLSAPDLSSADQAGRTTLSATTAQAIIPADATTLHGYALLDDIYGQPAILLKTTQDRVVYAQGQASLGYFIAALAVVGIVFAVVMLLLLEWLILAKLAHLSACVRQIGVHDNFLMRLPIAGHDEFMQLASTINTMLNLVAQSRTALQQTNKELESEVSERTQAEARIRRLNRTLSMLSDINQAIVRLRALPALFETACQIAVESGGFRMAWIGSLDAETRRVTPVAYAGVAGDYLDKIDIRLDDAARGRGPAALAVQTGQYVVFHNIEHDPAMAPWRSNALALGYRTTAVFPLKVAGQVRGTFALYSSEAGFFDEGELALLDELAADLSFAMEFAEQESQRRQADDALRQNEARWRALIEKSSDAFLLVGADGVVIYDSPSTEQVTGYTPDERSGRNMSDRVHPDDQEMMAALLARVISTPETTATAQLRTRHKDQSWHWFEGVVTNLLHEPSVGALVINYRDVTERKQSEGELARYHDHLEHLVEDRTAELNRAKTRLEAILNSTIDGIVLASPQRGIEQTNITFNTLFASEPDGYFGQSLLSLVQSEDRERLAALIQAVSADGTGRHEEYRAVRADQTVFEARIGIGTTQAGEIMDTGLVCSVQDISDLKERERLLRFHASLQENVSDAVIATDLQFRVQSWNSAAERIYGWHAEEVLGRSIGDVLPTEFVSEASAERMQQDFIEKGFWSDEVTQYHKDGRMLDILNSTVVFRDDQGQSVGMVLVNHDITERKAAERLLQAKMQEERAFQAALKELHTISLDLTQLDSQDGFYRRVVELGLQYLGFERLALFLYDAPTGSALGTYGTDPQGQIRHEHALRFAPNPQGMMMRTLEGTERFCLDEPVLLYDNEQPMGMGWNAAATLWSGSQMVGWLVADNLIEQKPASKTLLEIFALYALTVGTLLGQKQAVTALRESEEKFRLFVESAPEAIVICNRQGTITLVNAEAEHIFGYHRAELIGQAVELLVPEVQREVHQRHRDRYAAAPSRRSGEALPEFPARRKDGSQFPAEIQLSAVQTLDDLLVISFIADISERKQAEAILQRALEEQKE